MNSNGERKNLSHKSRNFSHQTLSFFGRQKELAELSNLLANPACRLLTLIGVGGVGKTCLALKLAENVQNDFTQGVYFVSLQPVSSITILLATLADTLNLPLSGQEDPRLRLVNYLRDKEILLILDNFEHLLQHSTITDPSKDRAVASKGINILADILQHAPSVQLLVTSREGLNIREEWLYPIQGLDVPTFDSQDDLEKFSAIRLFVERAQRVRPDFSLDAEGQTVVEICQLVDGVPLAIELAASWTRMLTSKEIAVEIQKNLDFLKTNLRNIQDRHRSMRAVFDQSWRFLSPEEREIFERLSVFHGGFDGKAAGAVAEASLMTLALFTDKSLLERQSDGRYQIHELLRQYAAEQLRKSSDNVRAVRNLHCTYYTDYLGERFENILGGQQRQAATEIEAELDNIRSAWQWAIDAKRMDALATDAPVLAMFYQLRSRYLEGAQMFEMAVRALVPLDRTSEVELALVALLMEQAWFYIRLGKLEQAEAALLQCEELYQHLDIPPIPGLATDPSLGFSALAAIRGDYPRARQLAEQALELSLLHNHLQNQQVANYFAVQPTLALGDYQHAHQYAVKAYQGAQKTQDRWSMSYYLNELGDVARALGKDAEAQQHYRLSYALREEFDDAEGMALALNRLADLAAQKSDFSEAERIYTQSRSIYEEIGDKGGLATSLHGLGVVLFRQGNYASAREHLRQALQTALEIQFIPRVLSILLSVAELFLDTGSGGRGLELLALAAHHPAVDRETKELAQLLLDQYRTQVPGEQLKTAIQLNQELDLETKVEVVLVELAGDTTETKLHPERLASFPLDETQPLVDPLTPRELEVLDLIAAGLTNRDIAEMLVIAVGTVKRYTAEIYRKLDVHSRTQAVARARELNILT